METNRKRKRNLRSWCRIRSSVFPPKPELFRAAAAVNLPWESPFCVDAGFARHIKVEWPAHGSVSHFLRGEKNSRVPLWRAFYVVCFSRVCFCLKQVSELRLVGAHITHRGTRKTKKKKNEANERKLVKGGHFERLPVIFLDRLGVAQCCWAYLVFFCFFRRRPWRESIV